MVSYFIKFCIKKIHGGVLIDIFWSFQCGKCSIILGYPVEFTEIQVNVSAGFSRDRNSFFKFGLGCNLQKSLDNLGAYIPLRWTRSEAPRFSLHPHVPWHNPCAIWKQLPSIRGELLKQYRNSGVQCNALCCRYSA